MPSLPTAPPPFPLELRIKRRPVRLVLVGVLIALAAIGWFSLHRAPKPQQPIGLFTALPIWLGRTAIADELQPDARPHWARAELQRYGTVVPLDTLDAAGGSDPLRGVTRLILAQPRVLTPAENVALDNWVRGGGHLLLIIDPAYTEESPFALGDPRRPPAQAMLSPILTRWGLELQFDSAQPLELRLQDVMGAQVPTVLAGTFATRGQGNCRLWGGGIAVTCAIGKGRILALADAALLERDDPDGAGAKAFSALLDSAFAAN